jgi:hypothetical protein
MSLRRRERLGIIIQRRFAIEIQITFRRLIAGGSEQVSPQRSLIRIEPARVFYQREEAIVRDVFGGFSRTQHSIGESKNRVTITLVQDLERFSLAFRCVLQQPLVCLLVFQSKRSSCRLPYCCITTKGDEVTENSLSGADFFAPSTSCPPFKLIGDLAGLRALMPRSGFRLTGLEAASKLFFPTSQTSLRVVSLPETADFRVSKNGSIS